jgi:hypothetical protein
MGEPLLDAAKIQTHEKQDSLADDINTMQDLPLID